MSQVVVPPELFAQAPVLALIVVLVFGFLKYIRDRDNDAKVRDEAIAAIVKENQVVIKENTIAIAQNSQINQRVIEKLG